MSSEVETGAQVVGGPPRSGGGPVDGYRVQSSSEATLSESVTIRAYRPGDEQGLVVFSQGLSPNSRFALARPGSWRRVVLVTAVRGDGLNPP